ncbi:hypothetical protein [Microlunatus phosphovorus]|uniref:hypothetical protein n=1 Tax=Microlunatus phosphovorus TaxID=29405 RepID=UPI0002FE8691|nr:hypothetical protein [Microlunatus phosphovorus]
MPTTTVETPLDGAPFRRRVAKDLTFWWRRHGVDPAHVVTRFLPGAADRVFLGPFPNAGDRAEVPFAFVVCVLAADRDAAFRAAYARQVRRVLGPDIPPERVFVAMQSTDPADHFTPTSDWGTEENTHD